jgi:hypothetical protein
MVVEIWRALNEWIFDPYRPELHYMRCPGPKWREKHAHVSRKQSIARVSDGDSFGQLPSSDRRDRFESPRRRSSNANSLWWPVRSD